MTSGSVRKYWNKRVYGLLLAGSFAVGVTVTTPAAAQPTLSGCPLQPADNIWNTPVDKLPMAANSAAFVSTIGSAKTLRADFGSGLWDGGPIGIPFLVVPGSQTKYPATFDYADESDPGPYAVPLNAPIEGGSQSSGDRHAIAVDKDSCILYELYAAYPQSNRWQAGSGAIYNLRSNALRPSTWTSADAAGLPILPGLVRYDEVASGEIRHAIRFTVPQTRKSFVWPARHYASSLTGSQYPPMGQRFRLKDSFDISGYSPEIQVILRALKKYGMILADNGSAWYLSGAPDERWNNDRLRELLRVTGSNLEAVDVTSLMIDPNSGQAKQQNDTTPVPLTLSITPVSATVETGGSVQFTATVTGGSGQAVTWSAGGVAGGNGTVGTINGAGLYTAPMSASASIPITAAIGTVSASATVTVLNPAPPPPPPQPPAISLSRSLLSFSFQMGGGAVGPQVITVSNSGGSALSWTAVPSNFWITVAPTAGSASGQFAVGIAPSGLAPGTYNGAVTVSGSGATAQSVAVSLTVTAASAILSVAPGSLTFSYQIGASEPAAQALTMTNGGGGFLSWTASTSVPWLIVTPQAGNAPSQPTVRVVTGGLTTGSYAGAINISAGTAGSMAIAVNLTISNDSSAPQITAVVNAASYGPEITQNTWITITGKNLAFTTREWGASDFVDQRLPTELDGTSVTINGKSAYINYVSPEQLNVLAPVDSTVGKVALVVTRGTTSTGTTVELKPLAPAMFVYGSKPYVAATFADGQLIAPSTLFSGASPAHAGDEIVMYGTGFGQTSPRIPEGVIVSQPSDLPSLPIVRFGQTTALVRYAGLSGAGLYQVNVKVPENVAIGDVLVTVEIGGAGSPAVYIPVE
jgi:uncharacterized protein (TIGR03437 family)